MLPRLTALPSRLCIRNRKAALTVAASSASASMQQQTDIRKPCSDSRSYRHVRLANGATCMLVQDAEAVFAAAVVSVHCGYVDDPQDLAGLSHFLEHAVHLGSAKYPQERGYKHFLSQHGGTSNASTGITHTSYFFTVHSSQLHGALDRLAQFFVAPLLNPDSLGREVENVHAEYSRNCNSDGRKLLQLKRAVCAWPYSKFSTGNIATLRDGPALAGADVRSAMATLWEARYTAGELCAAVVGPQDLDTLQAWVTEALQGVRPSRARAAAPAALPSAAAPAVGGAQALERQPQAAEGPSSSGRQGQQADVGGMAASAPSNGHAAQADGGGQQQRSSAAGSSAVDDDSRFAELRAAFGEGSGRVLGPEQHGRIYCVAPSRELRQLELMWTLPYSSLAHAGCKPWRWAGHLLGHESEGSVAAYLKRQGLIQGLNAGVGEEVRLGREGQGFMTWGLTIELTEAGQAALPRVLAAVQRGLEALRAMGETQREAAWRELAQLAELRFDHQDRTDPKDLAKDLAYRLHYLQPTEILSQPALLSRYSSDAISAFLDRLTPDHLNVWYSSRLHAGKTGLKEPWYGAEYTVQPLPQELLAPVAELAEAGLVDPGAIHPPDANWALPVDTTVLPPGSPVGQQRPAAVVAPALLHDSHALRLWFRQDESFRVPKAAAMLHFITPADVTRGSAAASMTARLFLRVLEDVLLPQTYPATLTGTHYSFAATATGLTLHVEGFTSVLTRLLPLLLTALVGLSRGDIEQRFQAMAGRARQALTNWRMGNPAQHAEYASEHALLDPHYHVEELLAALEDGGTSGVHVDGVAALAQALPHRLYVEGLMYGNLDAATCHVLTEQISAIVRPGGLPIEADWPGGKVVRLAPLPALLGGDGPALLGGDGPALLAPSAWSAAASAGMLDAAAGAATAAALAAGRSCKQAAAGSGAEKGGSCGEAGDGTKGPVHVVYIPQNPNPSNSNHAVQYVLQCGEGGPAQVRRRVLLDLLVALAAKPAFHALRTQQRLGYVVSLREHRLLRTLGLSIRVQSPQTTPRAMEAAIAAWLASFRDHLAAMGPDDLAPFKASLREKYLQPPKSLHDAGQRAWAFIHHRTYNFEWRLQKAACLEELALPDVLDFYDAHIVPGAPAERRLCTHVWGGRSARDMDVVVAELEAARGGADGPSAHALVVTDAGLAAFKACQPRYSIGPLGDGALPPLTVGATHLSAL